MAGGGSQHRLARGLLVGVSGLAALALLWGQSGSSVQADIRLDDYETSWPDHIPRQELGVSLIRAEVGPDAEVHRRNDRSTIAVNGPEATDRQAMTQAILRAIAADVETISPVEPTGPTVDVMDLDLAMLEAAGSATDEEAVTLATERTFRRRDGSLRVIAADSARSRFVMLQPPTPDRTERPVGQLLVAAALAAAGFAHAVGRPSD